MWPHLTLIAPWYGIFVRHLTVVKLKHLPKRALRFVLQDYQLKVQELSLPIINYWLMYQSIPKPPIPHPPPPSIPRAFDLSFALYSVGFGFWN